MKVEFIPKCAEHSLTESLDGQVRACAEPGIREVSRIMSDKILHSEKTLINYIFPSGAANNSNFLSR